MTTEGLKKTKFTVKACGKFHLHYMSMLNDPLLQPRKLEASENIFDIIMPWLPEYKQEEDAKMKELVKLGTITEKQYKEASKKNVKAENLNKMKQCKLNITGSNS